MFRPTLEQQEQIDPAEALMSEVGAQLRKVRLERGEDLDQVADNLRIRSAYLEGIERGDLSIMPGRAYALGFLRSYAEYLGFDGNDLVKQIKSTVENLTDRTRLHIRAPLPESRVPKTSLVLLSLALLGGIYAGWSYLNHNGQLDVETVAEIPDDLQRPVLDPLPAATSEAETEGGAAAPATDEDRAPPAEAAAPASQPAETSEPSGPQSVDPGVRTGVSDGAPSGDQASFPRAMREPRTTEVPAAELPAFEPSRVDLPQASFFGSGIAGAPVDGSEISPATASQALDRIIEAERVRSAEAAGVGRSLPDAPVDRSNRTAESEAGSSSSDEAPVTPDAGPAGQPGPTAEDAALQSGRAQVGSAVDRNTRPDDGSSAAQSQPAREVAGLDAGRPIVPTAEEVLAALDPTASGSEATPQVYERENMDARVVIRARERSWIQIASASGDYVQSHTLEKGDVFLVPDRADLTLWTGNAGGLQVIVDGKTIAPLGPDGSVKKDIPLDPESLVANADAER